MTRPECANELLRETLLMLMLSYGLHKTNRKVFRQAGRRPFLLNRRCDNPNEAPVAKPQACIKTMLDGGLTCEFSLNRVVPDKHKGKTQQDYPNPASNDVVPLIINVAVNWINDAGF